MIRYHSKRLTDDQFRSFDPATSADLRKILRDQKDEKLGWDSRAYGVRGANASIGLPDTIEMAEHMVGEATGLMGIAAGVDTSSSALVPDSILHELGLWRFRPERSEEEKE